MSSLPKACKEPTTPPQCLPRVSVSHIFSWKAQSMGKKLGGSGEWTKYDYQEFDKGALLPLFLYYGSRLDIFKGKDVSGFLCLLLLHSHSHVSNGTILVHNENNREYGLLKH